MRLGPGSDSLSVNHESESKSIAGTVTQAVKKRQFMSYWVRLVNGPPAGVAQDFGPSY